MRSIANVEDICWCFRVFLIKLIHSETVQMLIFNALHGGIRHSPDFLLGIMAPLQGICWNG